MDIEKILKMNEDFKKYKESNIPQEALCIHGSFGGGPGYTGFAQCDLTLKHPNVRYSCEHCPLNCEDFEKRNEDELFGIFRLKYL